MQEQIYLNYVGRFVYGFRGSTHKPKTGDPDPDGKKYFLINGIVEKLEVSEVENLFRRDNRSLHGQTDRSFECKVKDIIDAIILKRLIDKSIYCEINLIGAKNICHSTYTNSFKFRNFTSNIEDHYFSKTGLHIAKVGSLSSYAQIDFECFDALDNSSIKYILTNGKSGTEIEFNNEISRQMSQMVSLFLCETSRNPASFLTIPMILEISEWFFILSKSITDEDQTKAISFIDLIHNESYYYNKLIEQRKKLKKDSDDKPENDKIKKALKKIEVDIKKNFVDSENIGNDIPKSKIVKDFILNLFPLSMEKAVQGCRYINNIISNKMTEESGYYQRYDRGDGSIKEARLILSIEKTLIKSYKQYLEYNEIDQDDMLRVFSDLAVKWYGISILELNNEELVLIGDALDTLL